MKNYNHTENFRFKCYDYPDHYGIAFHSTYPVFKKYLPKVIKNPNLAKIKTS